MDENLRRKARNLTVLSAAIIVYILGDGDVGGEITTGIVGVTFNNVTFIYFLVVALLLYYKYRFDIVNETGVSDIWELYNNLLYDDSDAKQLAKVIVEEYANQRKEELFSKSNPNTRPRDANQIIGKWDDFKAENSDLVKEILYESKIKAYVSPIGKENILHKFDVPINRNEWIKLLFKNIITTINHPEDSFWEKIVPTILFYIAIYAIGIRVSRPLGEFMGLWFYEFGVF